MDRETGQQPLDIISDVMALSSHRNVKNVILMAAEVKGPFDEAAYRRACCDAFADFPELASVLKEARNGWKRFLVRQMLEGGDVPVIVSDLQGRGKEASLFDAILAHLGPRLDRTWKLLEDPPVEMHVVNLDDHHRVLAILMHHSGGDAAMTLTLLRGVFARYEAVVKGRTAAWLGSPYVFSTAKKGAVGKKQAGFADVWRQIKKNLRYLNEHPVLPAGEGDPGSLHEFHARRVLPEADSGHLLAIFSQGNLHIADHLVACANLAMDEWNSTFDVSPGIITSVMTVNMRGRFGGSEEKNYSSAIFFRCLPEGRREYLDFVSQIAKRRSEQFQERLDLALRRSFAMGASLFSVLPFALRSRVAHAFMLRQQYSAAVGYLGVVFPEFNSGSPGATSGLMTFGDLEIADMFGTGYKLAGQASVNLYAYIYGGRLQLVLTSSGRFLTRDQNERLLDVLLDIVYRAGDLVASPQSGQ